MANIILADDDHSLRGFMAATLRKAGHEVFDCADGLAALAALEAQPPCDLLVTDIIMPGMDGLELAALAQKREKPPQILFVTGFAAMAAPMHKQGSNAPLILPKPFHLSHLVQIVEQLLNNSHK
jgi:two-component system, cell cycle response regulator CpdR